MFSSAPTLSTNFICFFSVFFEPAFGIALRDDERKSPNSRRVWTSDDAGYLKGATSLEEGAWGKKMSRNTQILVVTVIFISGKYM